MSLDAAALRDLTTALSDRLYLQVAGWHLYLGDAGLAEALAIECSARLDQGAGIAARQALEDTPLNLPTTLSPSRLHTL